MFITDTNLSIIILGGLSLRNDARTEKLQAYFVAQHTDATRIVYKHRQEGHTGMDSTYEAAQLQKLLSGHTPEQNILIIAKSAGCMVALQTRETYPELHNLKIKYIFMGFPASSIPISERYPTLEGIVIQNDHDPLASYEEIVQEFAGSKFETISLSGDTHHYEIEDLDKLNLKVF